MEAEGIKAIFSEGGWLGKVKLKQSNFVWEMLETKRRRGGVDGGLEGQLLPLVGCLPVMLLFFSTLLFREVSFPVSFAHTRRIEVRWKEIDCQKKVRLK
jgi:hypothetical protein